MGRETSCVAACPTATIKSTEVSVSSKRLLDQRHDETTLIVLKVESAIKAKQKINMKMSQTATPKLHRNVILRARSPLQLNKESITVALNEHSFSVDRTSDRRLDSAIILLQLILDHIQLCDAIAHCDQMLTVTHLRAAFFRASEAQTMQLMARCNGKLCEASTMTTVLGCVVDLPLFQVQAVPEPADGVE
jgi:hypothetical protein